ncbi:YciI family protein [Paenactinomyces guangxiensis]|uniref:YCII-related domain-containing protein n=1 Tax=Paenactinomyces guangxiensis TaxID=1490290 RepID=A0A7W1WS64_9BACL|nr:YciI family protein [Paenactinomyces guangxiensis]MBA4495066.1 hypothetical protein [Paenactinomyces guangxiensis]MBH8592250.1 hypothetical protein [Paenactinomyces guangxiensis]
MKQFVVRLSDKQKHLMTAKLITDHVNYLRQLKEVGRLPFCGPCTDGTAIMILKADSREEAEKLLASDPFSAVDYYKSRDMIEVEEATLENNFHLDRVLENI